MVGRELLDQDPLFLFLWWPFILITQNFFDRRHFFDHRGAFYDQDFTF